VENFTQAQHAQHLAVWQRIATILSARTMFACAHTAACFSTAPFAVRFSFYFLSYLQNNILSHS
jgi:hypothetical protein